MKNYLTLLFCLFAVTVFAQPRATLTLQRDTILIGDQVGLSLKVLHAPKISVSLPKELALSDSIEILKTTSSTQQNTLITTTKRLLITVFDSGTYFLPPVPVAINTDGDLDTIFSNAVQLTVLSPTVDTLQSIAPIKDIFEEPLSFREDVLPILLGVLAVLLLIALIYYLRKRKKKQQIAEAEAPSEPPVSPHIIALERLDDLEKQAFWQNGDYKTHHSEASYILREFLENCFDIPALESVTDEILRDLTPFHLETSQLNNLRKVLQTADLVKFAKSIPTEAEHRAAIELSRAFVRACA